nr:NAD(P)-dependent oxidoreductase [Acanthopleuribacter pedis]
MVTGANGTIGTRFCHAMQEHYELRMADQQTHALAGIQGERVPLDITDLSACRRACDGVDAVLHLAGIPLPDAPFEPLVAVNIVGTYHMLQAAYESGVSRFVFASSAQVNEGYPSDVQTEERQPVRPGNLYGVSKCSGEAMGAYFAYQHNLSNVAVRIANYLPELTLLNCTTHRDRAAYLSPRDANQLLRLCIDTPSIQFLIVNGVSNNRYKRLDLTTARERLNYQPKDDAFAILDL